MKKTIATRMSAIMLAAVMAVIFSFTSYTTAFAASETNETPALSVSDTDATTPNLSSKPEHGREEFEVTPNMINENGRIQFQLRDGDDDDDEEENVIDQWWYFTGYHRGSNRSYNATELMFSAKITDANGNSVGDEVAIDLKDLDDDTQHFTVYADNTWYGYGSIAITPNETYYFYYQDVTSSTTQLKIRMVIEW